MKPRVLTTQKILVAVVTATAAVGCARPAAEPTPTTAESVSTQVSLEPVAAPIEITPSPTEVASEVQHASTTDAAPEPKTDTKIYALAGELYALDQGRALAQKAHFRPLCDAEGFPVVGNVMRKAPGYPVSSFCAAVRENKGR